MTHGFQKGQGDAPAALLTALREQQQRRSVLQLEQQHLTELEHHAAIDDARLTDELAATAANVRAALTERTTEARRVLQALLPDRLEFSAFERDGVRGYEFVGTGSYGGLLAGHSCPTSGRGPNGIWQWDVFPLVPFQGLAMVSGTEFIARCP